MITPHFRAGPTRPRLVPNSIFVLAIGLAVATWHRSGAWGGVSGGVIGFVWLLWGLFDMEEATAFLRQLPRRTPPVPLPEGKEVQTVWGRIIASGDPLKPPSPVDGHVAAWSIDMHEMDIGGWSQIASPTRLLLENAQGVRFCVELDWQWLGITSQQVRIATDSPCPEADAVRREFAGPLRDGLGPRLDILRNAHRLRQSVFFADQWVAVTGRFRLSRSPYTTGYPRGEAVPMFRAESATIDDCSLDAAWVRALRFYNYAVPAIVLALSLVLLGVSAL